MDDKAIIYILGEVKSDVKSVLNGIKDIKEWQAEHEKHDSERIEKIHERINGLNRFATCIAIVAGVIGASAKTIYMKLFGIDS